MAVIYIYILGLPATVTLYALLGAETPLFGGEKHCYFAEETLLFRGGKTAILGRKTPLFWEGNAAILGRKR